MLEKIIGANWKTTLSGIGNTIASILLVISLIPYTLPTELSDILSPTAKRNLLIVGLIAKTVLGIWNSIQQKDKTVTGGTVHRPQVVLLLWGNQPL